MTNDTGTIVVLENGKRMALEDRGAILTQCRAITLHQSTTVRQSGEGLENHWFERQLRQGFS